MENAYNACMLDMECMAFVIDKAKILNDFYNYYANSSDLDAAKIYEK